MLDSQINFLCALFQVEFELCYHGQALIDARAAQRKAVTRRTENKVLLRLRMGPIYIHCPLGNMNWTKLDEHHDGALFLNEFPDLLGINFELSRLKNV